MKAAFASVILLGVILLSGCDGRGKILYLQPATAMAPPRSMASVVIPIRGDEDIVGMIAKVASDLGLSAEGENRWRTTTTYQNTFTLSVGKAEKGYWTVSLLDWPTVQRSQQSLKAEAMIRRAVQEPTQHAQAITGRNPALSEHNRSREEK